MFKTLRLFFVRGLVPLAILVVLAILFWQSLSARTESPAAPLLGFTPTPTSTITPTPLPAPSPTPLPPSQVRVVDPVITKRADREEALPGEEVTFTIQVTNRGQKAAVDVVVTDEISEWLEILEVATTQGTASVEDQTVTVKVGVVGPDFVVEIVILTRVRMDTPAPIDLENVAVFKSPNAGELRSPPVIVHVPDLSLPPTGGQPMSQLAFAILASGLVALSAGLWIRKLSCRYRRNNLME